MVVVRNVFQLKFGKAKEAVALMKEGLAIQKRAMTDVEFSTRVLTDVTGPFYTLVLELSVPTGMREGVVDSWAERIPLPPLPLGDPVDPGEPAADRAADMAADIDVPVDPRP